jgi:hypothetical protein
MATDNGALIDEKERLRRACSSVFIATAAIALLAIAFVALAYQERWFTAFEERHVWSTIMLGVLALLLLIGAGLLTPDKASLGVRDTRITDVARGRFVAVLTILFIAFVSGVCAMTGGTSDSPFTHMLIAASTVGIVYTRSWWTKFTVLFACLIPYYRFQTGWLQLPPAAKASDMLHVLDLLCLGLALTAAIFTAKGNPSPPSPDPAKSS